VKPSPRMKHIKETLTVGLRD